MHLIHVSTLRLHEFYDDAGPKYAILSHTWEDDEVSFKDMQSLELSQLRQKRGFQKIQYTCDEAHKRGLRWAWVDTCCIDKSSSAELSEAINSMYAWYQRSEICFAYLSDVPHDARPQPMRSSFRLSRWFSRGWTLQELIAPAQVVFYGANWTFIGDKLLLCMVLEETIGIPCDLLLGQERIESFSIAQRMAWASRRQTTRVEDTAYCLLGLCEINMPLLYGEGGKAFRRLQEEIIKQTDDQSLLAWTVDSDSPMAWTLSSVLATSPANFAKSSQVQNTHEERGDPSIVTKKGVQVHAPLLPIQDYPIDRILYKYCDRSTVHGLTLYRVPLNCGFHSLRVCLTIMQIDWDTVASNRLWAHSGHRSFEGNLFVRVLLPMWDTVQDEYTFLDPDSFDKFFLRTNMASLPETQNIFKSKGGSFHFHGIKLTYGKAALDHRFGENLGSWHLRETVGHFREEQTVIKTLGPMNAFGFLFLPRIPWKLPSDQVYLGKHGSKGYRFKPLARDCPASMKFFIIEGPTDCPPLYLVCGTTLDPDAGDYRGNRPRRVPRGGVLAEPYIFCNLLPELSAKLFPRCSLIFFQPKGRVGPLIALEARHGRTAVSVDLHRDKGFDPPGVKNRTGFGAQSPHFIFEIHARAIDDSATNSDEDDSATGSDESALSSDESSGSRQIFLDNSEVDSDQGIGGRESAEGGAISRQVSKPPLALSSGFRSQASSHTPCATKYQFEDYWCDIYTRDHDGTLQFRQQYRL
ncbi:hypothetical protein KVR01_011554 [Diaporthe batatas]|uniref:uncharacterized protein n=1 Tax=Diaporthe batatas TaxID=748121 RepID=UPI001D04D1CD|nr:uncharacterized protein KVR01_011554 [Diaporthe batatas]KAG8158432.1 hypothetical protein KVR01_011554 [Diaporthe batatas]